MAQERKVILYIAMSLDGYIAKPGDDLSFLSIVEQEGEDYGYTDFISTVDTVIMGRKTYDWVVSHATNFPHENKQTFIITNTPRPSAGNTSFYSGNLQKLITELKNKEGKNIFIDGGAELVNELLKDGLIDEFYISVIPVLLGAGIKLFKEGLPEQNLILISSKYYDTGLVQLHYIFKDIGDDFRPFS